MSTALIGALNGVIGDFLESSGNPLAIQMAYYSKDAPIEDLSKHAELYPNWDKRTAFLFIHGAAGSEREWRYGSSSFNYPERVAEDLKALPLMIRYNSGKHISENGRELAVLLNRIADELPVQRLVIVGHSMGGLIFRSACHYADDARWMNLVDSIFYLGSPHLGASLEKFGAWTERILDQIPNTYTRLASKLIGIRSNGIKDLRHGYLQDEEWMADEHDVLPRNNKLPHDQLEGAEHYFVVGSYHDHPESIIATWLGDLMVGHGSASYDFGQHPHSPLLEEEHLFMAPRHHHIRLMYSPKIYRFIRRSLQKQAVKTT